ncbi:MAG TPA: hypothetical protein VFZ65_00880 [Planctomycetota bacterium]|nr:hypothetical protein [Planctomycetota bacterium]
MFRSLRSFLSAAAVATALFGSTPGLRAQTGERSRWDQVTLGNQYAGIDVIGWARSRNTGTERRVDEMAQTQLRLLGIAVEMQRIAATAIRNGSSFWGSTGFRRGGFTVRNDSLTNTGTVSYTSSASVFAAWPTLAIYIFGFPITVGATANHTGVMNMQLQNLTNMNASTLNGSMDSYASGWAAASAGIPGLMAGAAANLTLGHQHFGGLLAAYTNYITTANLDYSMTPVQLYLFVFAQFGLLWGEVTLVNTSLGARNLAPFMP